jgi:hypothetical protein
VPELQTGRAGDVTTVIAAPQHRAVSCGLRASPSPPSWGFSLEQAATEAVRDVVCVPFDLQSFGAKIKAIADGMLT